VLKIKVHQSQYRPITGLEGFRRSRFPDFKTIGTRRSFYLQKIFLVLLSVRAGVDIRIIVQPE
jgi:hypothetical protein